MIIPKYLQMVVSENCWSQRVDF